MIPNAVVGFFTWQVAIAFVLGFVFERLVAVIRCRWLNRYRPLSNGKGRRVGGYSRVWIAGVITAAIFGLIMVETQRNSDCIDEFKVSLVKRSAITTENDRLSREQRTLLAQFDETEAAWLLALLNPPGDLAALALDDPARQAYGYRRTQQFVDEAAAIRAKIETIESQQDDLARERAENPLPDPKCD